MNKVRSKDGTDIAYTRGGDGPALVLVGGGLDDTRRTRPSSRRRRAPSR